MADRINRALILFVLAAWGLILFFSGMRVARAAQRQAASLPAEFLSDRDIQAIAAPSGAPIVLYDPAHKRLMLVVGALPRGTEVCINKRCLLDTGWTALADRADH